MYILKNAYTSLMRNKGRNILIGIIVLVIAIAATISLAIVNSVNHLIKSYEDSYETTASIEVNRGGFMEGIKGGEKDLEDVQEEFSNLESLTVEEIITYGDSSYVTSYTYTESIGVEIDGVEAASSDFEGDDSNFKGDMEMPDNVSSTSFTLVGYNSASAMSEFLSGTYTISEGSIDSDFTSNTCVINEELATLNDLEVGDTITIVNPNDSSLTYELTISGIYADSSESSGMDLFSASANTIITNTTVLENISGDDDSLMVTVTPTYYLTSSDVVDAFESELHDKGLSDSYTVTTNLDEQEEALSNITSIRTFSITFLVITLIIGVIVLLVINMINIRDRKYEIGVLRTIGMKKSLVASQFICELLMVTCVSLVIGLGIGAALSVPTANMLLANEISSSSEKMDDVRGSFGGEMDFTDIKIDGVSNVTKITDLDVVVDVTVIIELLGIGLLLTLISSLASVMAITRFSPLTILKERS